ncbi:vespid v5 venom allergen-like protein, partial [Dinothrombium tinctorium]
SGLTTSDIELIISLHNELRNKIANGEQSKHGFPSAANMMEMEWDDELSSIAQWHASQCRFKHESYAERRSMKFKLVGQNLFLLRKSRFDLQPKWSKIINLWYEELQIAPNSVVHNFNLHGLNIGHFTQMAWASSRKIGCGFAAFRIVDPKFKVAHLYTCNYAPSGNRKGNSMYLEGAAMSRCPQSTQPSKKYSALCSYSDLEKKIKMNKIYVQPNNKTKTFQ